MTKQVLILGATGQIAGHAITALLDETDDHLLLFTRHPQHLTVTDEARETVIKGDTLDTASLGAAVAQADVVYANLRNPEIEQQAKNEMLGGGQEDSYLGTYRKAADVISASDLDYTIIRPAWLTNKDEVEYETTERGEAFKGTEVSRKSIGTLVATIIADPAKYARKDLGVNKPHTDGDKPAWY